MTIQRIRTVIGAIHMAQRVDPRVLPPTESLASKQGLRYEKRVTQALSAFASAKGHSFEAQSWFTFRDDEGEGLCVPDAIILQGDASATIVEVKLTYTPAAFTKLSLLYIPIVSRVLQRPCAGLVICKHMTPFSPKGAYSMSEALRQKEPVMQWLGYGPLPQ